MKKTIPGWDDARITPSSGNVFVDLGFDEAEIMTMRVDLMVSLEKHIDSQGWTQAETAKRLGITQPRVSKLKKRSVARVQPGHAVDSGRTRRSTPGVAVGSLEQSVEERMRQVCTHSLRSTLFPLLLARHGHLSRSSHHRLDVLLWAAFAGYENSNAVQHLGWGTCALG